MKIIKSVDELPEWFREAKYHKGLSAADWYREVRKRQWAKTEIKMAIEQAHMPASRPESLFRACYKTLKRNWSEYRLYGIVQPVRDMTIAEATFLAAANHNEDARHFFNAARALIEHYRHELSCGRSWASFEYTDHLASFLDDWHDTGYPGLNDMAYRSVHDNGNPMLDQCRPFEGFPILIDLAFDDETILADMKRWLIETRRADEPRARRPFSKNDFSDWENYKIRELHDLDLWSSISGVKIQDRVIAAALWPHAADGVSPIDVLRTTTRKKVREVFNDYVEHRLYAQLTIELGENFLDE